METEPDSARQARSSQPWGRRDLVAVAALVVLWVLCFWRYFAWTPENQVSLATGDFTDHFYVLRSFAYDELRAGRFPLWGGDGVFSVYPFQADPESALAAMPHDYSVSVRLVSPEGGVVSQDDGWPGRGRFATSGWPVGQTIRDTHYLALPPSLPSQALALQVLIYETDTLRPLSPAPGYTLAEFPLH